VIEVSVAISATGQLLRGNRLSEWFEIHEAANDLPATCEEAPTFELFTRCLMWVRVHHEGVAAAADSYVTDELAVRAGSSGPRNLHLVSGQEAMAERSAWQDSWSNSSASNGHLPGWINSKR
jgi:hypothetical protein